MEIICVTDGLYIETWPSCSPVSIRLDPDITSENNWNINACMSEIM